ncbi:hypothetical protein CGI28_25605, partial [Vibrio parahaemolyticus]
KSNSAIRRLCGRRVQVKNKYQKIHIEYKLVATFKQPCKFLMSKMLFRALTPVKARLFLLESHSERQ